MFQGTNLRALIRKEDILADLANLLLSFSGSSLLDFLQLPVKFLLLDPGGLSLLVSPFQVFFLLLLFHESFLFVFLFQLLLTFELGQEIGLFSLDLPSTLFLVVSIVSLVLNLVHLVLQDFCFLVLKSSSHQAIYL